MCIVGVVLINTAFVHFTYVLVNLHEKHRRQLLSVHLINAFFSYAALFLFYVEWKQKYTYGLWPIPSKVFHFYIVWWFLQVIYCFYLIRKQGILKSTGKARKQYQWIFWATLIAYAGGATNWLVWYDINFPPYLNSGIAIYTIVLAYAIFRHQLLGIDVIIKKTVVFAGISFLVFGSFATTSFLITNVLRLSTTGQATWWLYAIVGMIVAAVVRPIDKLLVNITDKYLFQKKINYRLILREASQHLAKLDSLKRQARRIVAFLIRKVRVSNAAVYVFTATDQALALKACRPFIRKARIINVVHPLVQYLYKYKSPVSISWLEEQKKLTTNLIALQELNRIVELMVQVKAEAAIPCFGGEASYTARKTEMHLRGVLFIGHQKSDEPFTQEDLDVFFTLGQESSIAFENARLYDEAVERRSELEKKNIELVKVQSALLQSLHETEEAKNEALAAKRKTEEMEIEVVRREKLVFVEKLVKGIAHEIFNPMTPMLHQVDRLDEVLTELHMFYDDVKNTLPDAKRKHVVEQFRLFREAVRVFNVTMKHLFLVVDTLGQMQKADDKTIKPFDFKSFWTNASNMIKAQTHGEILEEVPVEEDIQANLPPVVGNPVQLTQVFLNLYRNALHALNGQPERKIMIKAWLEDGVSGFLSISFSDTGMGMSPEVKRRIFEYMFTTKGEKGQGIGLSMCKTIIERFGGSIQCESKQGEGTTFFITLPINKEE